MVYYIGRSQKAGYISKILKSSKEYSEKQLEKYDVKKLESIYKKLNPPKDYTSSAYGGIKQAVVVGTTSTGEPLYGIGGTVSIVKNSDGEKERVISNLTGGENMVESPTYNTLVASAETHTDPSTGVVTIIHRDSNGNILKSYQREASAEDLNYAKGNVRSFSPEQTKTFLEASSPSFLQKGLSMIGAGDIGLTDAGGDPIKGYEEKNKETGAIPTLNTINQSAESLMDKYGVLAIGGVAVIALLTLVMVITK
jgi:hypothetical protein